ncbi:MAG: glycosyltransferase [Acidobacteria bacterium]|nr:glycosyltransferase [Acidobacteriota bacterium]
MTQPDFSIIIPTFSRPLQLAECLQALDAQNFPKDLFEVIVVDDGGDIPAVDAISRFRQTLAITGLRQQNKGPSSARNAGARISRGKYLAFTDDDCRPAPDWLIELQKCLRLNHDCLAGGRVINALEENPYSEASQLIVDLVYAYYRSDQGDPRFFASNNIGMSAEAFRNLGGFAMEFRTSEDRDFCDRWINSGHRLAFAPDAVVRHAHRLNLGDFWRQHVGYGRGAAKFYRSYRTRHKGKSSIEPEFYWSLLRKLPGVIGAKAKNRAMLTLLMIVWQAANAAGFLAEIVAAARIQSAERSDKNEGN